jgi:hypothetical protein
MRRYASRTLAHRLAAVSFGAAWLLGCSSQALSSDDGDAQGGTAQGGTAQGGTAQGGSAAIGMPQVETATLTQVYKASAKVPLSATAVAFNASVDGELWVALRQFPSDKPCTIDIDTGCDALRGRMGVVSDATGAAPRGVIKEDGNSWHFMRRPTSIAWGDGALFSACGEGYTDNYEDDTTPYAGPALWSSDPSIFGVKPLSNQNGTHIDMLHETPYCMGMAHESANAFWAFNGDAGSLDRVDFHAPHRVGGDDHSDGEVRRFVAGQLKREPEVPSQLAYDAERQLVYVADTGNGRVLSVSPSTAQQGGEIDVYEELASSGRMEGAEVSVLVGSNVLQKPSGLALFKDKLYVSDNATSLVYQLDLSGKVLRIWDTALPSGSVAGIALGPDGRLYAANLLDGSVERVEAP